MMIGYCFLKCTCTESLKEQADIILCSGCLRNACLEKYTYFGVILIIILIKCVKIYLFSAKMIEKAKIR